MKDNKCRKFGNLLLKTVVLVKFLKTQSSTENVSEFCVGLSSLDHMQAPLHSLLKLRGIFCF